MMRRGKWVLWLCLSGTALLAIALRGMWAPLASWESTNRAKLERARERNIHIEELQNLEPRARMTLGRVALIRSGDADGSGAVYTRIHEWARGCGYEIHGIEGDGQSSEPVLTIEGSGNTNSLLCLVRRVDEGDLALTIDSWALQSTKGASTFEGRIALRVHRLEGP